MSGTVLGRVDCVVTTPPNGDQETFINCKQFFDALVVAGYGVIYASNYGDTGGTPGTGWDFHDGANPAKENAWFVFEWALSASRPGGGADLGKVYTLVQWASDSVFGSAPGNPGKISGADANGIAFQTVFLEDGTSPWGGTSAANGADTKGATVWSGAGGLHVLDKSCASGGSFAANRENMLAAFSGVGATGGRVHFLADEDNFLMLWDYNNLGQYAFYYAGLYSPHSHVTVSYPMIAICHNAILPLQISNVYGTTTGTGTREGAMMSSDSAGPAEAAFSFDRLQSILGIAAQQPNPQSATQFDETDLCPYFTDLPMYGWPGKVNFIREAYNVATHEANAALTRASFGSNVTASIKITAPWGSVSPPGTGVSRTGRSF
jgi:hypothetical protein